MELELYLLDGILMSLSMLLVGGYHVYLWQCLKNKPEKTSLGVQWESRRAWLDRTLQAQGGGGSMQVVQTLRNNLTIIILRATISITVSTAVAALTNNAYKAANSHVFGTGQSGAARMFAVKFGAAFVVSVSSFLCGSFAVAFLVDTSILVSTAIETAAPSSSHIQRLVDTGFALAFIGNRLMWLTFVVLLWSLGPIAVAICSLALVWGFSVMDFVDKSVKASNYY